VYVGDKGVFHNIFPAVTAKDHEKQFRMTDWKLKRRH